MKPMTLAELGEPRLFDGAALRLAATAGEYTQETTSEIVKQWHGFGGELHRRGAFPVVTYGICYPTQPMRYLCGVEASKLAELPAGWEYADIPAQRYACFAHSGGVEVIRSVWTGLWMHWAPSNKDRLSDGPMVEFYQEQFGMGNDHFEIWLPLR